MVAVPVHAVFVVVLPVPVLVGAVLAFALRLVSRMIVVQLMPSAHPAPPGAAVMSPTSAAAGDASTIT
jgi:hypothetical protein